MDEFDFKETPEKTPFRLGVALLNCATLFLTLGALALIGFYAAIFLNPFSDLNPLPPVVVAPTALPTQPPAQPTTPPDEPTSTPEPTATATPQPVISYGLQAGDNPSRMNSTIFYPELGCNFMAVTGQVFDNGPVAGLQVHITGSLNGEPIDKIGLTGAATQYGFGQYYEVQLGSQPIASENTLQATLLNAEGQPISAAHSFSTAASCEENLIMINFSKLP